MDLSDDFLDEAPAVRAGGKFQPKAKPKPRITKSAIVPPALSNPDSVQPDQSVNIADTGLLNPEDSSILANAAVVETQESSKQNNHCSDFQMWRKDVVLEQDSFEDIEDTAPKRSRAGGKFQPAAKPGTKKVSFGSGLVKPVDVVDDSRNLGKLDSSCSQVASTDASLVLPQSDACDDSQFSLGKTMAPDIVSVVESLDPFPTQSSDVLEANASEKSPDIITMDTLPSNEALTSDSAETAPFVASNNNGSVRESEIPAQCFDISPATRISDMTEVEAFPDVDTGDIIASGQQKGKFKPKTRSQGVKEKPSASAPQPDVHPFDKLLASETDGMEDGTIPVIPHSNVLDQSMQEPSTHEIPTNEEQNNLPETSNAAAVAPSVDVPVIPEKVITYEKRRKNAATRSEKSKKKVTFTDEPENEMRDDHCIADESASVSVSANDGVDDNGDVEQVASSSTKKRAPRKPKKAVVEKEKPAQKRKKSNKELDNPTEEQPPKKFKHATRRKKRCVDKALLEDEDLDLRSIAIRDLILLAEHKEREKKKEEKALNATPANQSTQNSSRERDVYNEENSFASEQGQESNEDEDDSPPRKPDEEFFNNHTYMDKDPRVRWSKPDTERFYAAIRQFGSDFTMIQQLFPGRTRHQIKLKFKNEERRHPMKINEAVVSRSKDHSHFEEVIKYLQEKQDAEEVEELAPETNEQEEKTELKKDEGEELENQTADAAGAHSPPKSDEDEDDETDMWELYKNM